MRYAIDMQLRINKLYRSFMKYLYRRANIIKLFLKRVIPNEVWPAVRSLLPGKTFHAVLSEVYTKEWQEERRKYTRLPVLQEFDAGINLIGYLRAAKGIGEAARGSALALSTTSIPYSIVDYEYEISQLQQVESVPVSIYGTGFQFSANLIHINPPQLPFLWNVYTKYDLAARYNIGVWYWELPGLPPEWLPAFGLVKEIWVATQFIFDSLSAKAPIPVVKIPPCIRPTHHQHLTRSNYGLPPDRFLFMCAYDVLSTQARKNPQGTVDAFKRAFPKNDSSVGLVIKVSNAAENPKEVKQLRDQMKGYSNCYIIEEIFDKPTFNSLLNVIDAYISLHRSEGFGLIPAEAMSFGKPVIMTRWSGNLDFMTPTNSCGVDYKLIQVNERSGPYMLDQLWADPDIDLAAIYMQRLVSDREYYAGISEQAKKTIQDNYSPQHIGFLIKERMRSAGLIS